MGQVQIASISPVWMKEIHTDPCTLRRHVRYADRRLPSHEEDRRSVILPAGPANTGMRWQNNFAVMLPYMWWCWLTLDSWGEFGYALLGPDAMQTVEDHLHHEGDQMGFVPRFNGEHPRGEYAATIIAGFPERWQAVEYLESLPDSNATGALPWLDDRKAWMTARCDYDERDDRAALEAQCAV